MRYVKRNQPLYQMVERVQQAGWPKQRVVVIDEDHDKSGAVAKSRSGFEQLVTSVGRGEAGSW